MLSTGKLPWGLAVAAGLVAALLAGSSQNVFNFFRPGSVDEAVGGMVIRSPPGYALGSGRWHIPMSEPAEFLTYGAFDFLKHRADKFGNVSIARPLGFRAAILTGAEGMRTYYDTSLIAREGSFPSLFIKGVTGGLILNMLDGEQFRERRARIEEFVGYRNPAVVDKYLPAIHRIIERHFRAWQHETSRGEQLKLVHALHLMCAEIGTTVLLGLQDDGDAAAKLVPKISRCLKAGQAAPIYVPGTSYYHGNNAARKLLPFYNRILREHMNSSELAGMTGPTNSKYPHGMTKLARQYKNEARADTPEGVAVEVHHSMMAITAIVGNALADIVIALQQYPEVRAKMEAEITQATQGLPWEVNLQEKPDDLYDPEPGVWRNYGTGLLSRLKYTTAVADEVRRLFPFVSAMFGIAKKDFDVRGHRVTKGTTVIGAFYPTNLDASEYSFPLRFIPERFTDWNEPRSGKEFAWVPHGSGHHQCPGMDLTTAIMQSFLLHIVKDGAMFELPVQDLEQDMTLFNPEPKDGLIVNRFTTSLNVVAH